MSPRPYVTKGYSFSCYRCFKCKALKVCVNWVTSNVSEAQKRARKSEKEGVKGGKSGIASHAYASGYSVTEFYEIINNIYIAQRQRNNL